MDRIMGWFVDGEGNIRRGNVIIAGVLALVLLVAFAVWLGVPELISSVRAQPTPSVEVALESFTPTLTPSVEVALESFTPTPKPPTSTPEPPTPTPVPPTFTSVPVGSGTTGTTVPQTWEEAKTVLGISDGDATYLTPINPAEGDPTVVGWILGTSASEAAGLKLVATHVPGGLCVDYDPAATDLSGLDVATTVEYETYWHRSKVAASGGRITSLKVTFYWECDLGTEEETGAITLTGAPQTWSAAKEALGVSDEHALYLTCVNLKAGDPTVIGWILGTGSSEAAGRMLVAESIPGGSCLDYDPRATDLSGLDIEGEPHEYAYYWHRAQIGVNGGRVESLKITIYWGTCTY